MLSAAFTGRTRLERWIRGVLRMSVGASTVALVVVSAIHGWDRQDSFEIPLISVVWLTLVVVGPLISHHLRSRPFA